MTRSEHSDSPQLPDRLSAHPPSVGAASTVGRVIAHGPSLPPGLTAAPNASVLLRALQRRWLLALFLGLIVGLGTAASVWFLVPLKYPVEAVVKVTPRVPWVLNEDKNLVNPDMATFQKTMAAIVRRPLVLSKALDLQLPSDAGPLAGKYVKDLPILAEQADPLAWLEKKIKAEYKESPELLQITIWDTRKEMAKLLVNAVAQSFIKVIEKEDNDLRRARRDAVTKKLEVVSKNLRELRRVYQLQLSKELTGASEKNGKGGGPIDRQQLMTLQLELLQTEKELEKLSAAPVDEQGSAPSDLLKGPKQNSGRRPESYVSEEDIKAAVDAALDREEFVRQQTALIAKYQADFAKDRSLFDTSKGTPPQLQKVSNRLEEARKVLETYKQEKAPVIRQQLEAQAHAARKAQRTELQAQSHAQQKQLEQWHKKLTNQIALGRQDLERQQLAEFPLRKQKEELDSAEAFAALLNDATQKLDLERDAPPRAAFSGEPEIKTEEAEMRHMLLAGGAGSAGLVLTLLGVSVWEFRRRRVTTGDDVVQGLGWRLIGALPAMPPKTRGMLRSREKDKYWRSLLTESVDATRTTLLHAARTEGVRTVMVTSAVAGEGKTSLSSHLATSLARAGRKTLLIDSDLRSPAVHRLFEVPNQPGLSELLRGEVDVKDVICATAANNLWLIPAGQCDPHTLQALAQDALAPVLDQLKAQFDFIIIDSSPVLPIVDALVISQHVDVVIFSLLRDVSRIPNVYAAYQRLSGLGVRMLGAVVNGVDQDTYGYSMKYYSSRANG
jgi:capsular exopolysaccharide synthesis family protein